MHKEVHEWTIPNMQQSVSSSVVVGGVLLAFPYPPYPSQVCLANQIIRAIKTRKHALLESPTGTGNETHSCCNSSMMSFFASMIAVVIVMTVQLDRNDCDCDDDNGLGLGLISSGV